ncbi:hypothetical protein Tco_0107370, partial [Tanacetum coccineum]
MSVYSMPNGKNYFSRFYFCFKGLREGWLQGCRRAIGLDGCFLKTICKGELLSAEGRDGNNQIYPIAWAVVSVKNKGIIEAAKQVMPLDEHKQCARHIYANFRKKYTEVQCRNLFWKAAKATYPTSTDKACDAVENGISECFNAIIVDARRKLIRVIVYIYNNTNADLNQMPLTKAK